MFAYCVNNPVNNADPTGNDPILIAAAGAAVAGALISLYFYIETSGSDANLGGALLALSAGALAGALGGAAGMMMINPLLPFLSNAQVICVLGAGIVSSLISGCSGGSFNLGLIFGMLGAYLGTTIDISMYEGISLFFASLIASLGVGFPIEMASQNIYQDLYENQPSTPEFSQTETGDGKGSSSGSGGGARSSFFRIAFGL